MNKKLRWWLKYNLKIYYGFYIFNIYIQMVARKVTTVYMYLIFNVLDKSDTPEKEKLENIW